MLTRFFNAGAPFSPSTLSVRTVSGFWLPQEPTFGAILCWQGDLSDHRTAILYNTAQVTETLQGLSSWLDVNKRSRMLINARRILPEHSSQKTQVFGDLAAGLLHMAALYEDAFDASLNVAKQ